jgi:hypothetical protein
MKSLALTIAKTGQQVPDAILNLLPANQRSIYQGMSGIFAETKKSSGNNNNGNNNVSLTVDNPEDYDTFAKNYQDVYQMSIRPDAPVIKQAYDEYVAQFKSASPDNEYQTYAQKYADGDINVTQLEAKFGKKVKNQILAQSADLTKTQDNSELGILQELLSPTDKQNMYSLGLDWNKLSDIQSYLNGE